MAIHKIIGVSCKSRNVEGPRIAYSPSACRLQLTPTRRSVLRPQCVAAPGLSYHSMRLCCAARETPVASPRHLSSEKDLSTQTPSTVTAR